MKALSLFLAALATALPIAAIASDGYLGWIAVTFEDGAGWRVHVTESNDRIANGFTRITAVEISRHGAAVEIPASATADIRDPLLNDVKLLSACCSDEVKLQIPVLPTDELREACKRRIWELSIVGGKFAGTAAHDVQDGSGLCG